MKWMDLTPPPPILCVHTFTQLCLCERSNQYCQAQWAVLVCASRQGQFRSFSLKHPSKFPNSPPGNKRPLPECNSQSPIHVKNPIRYLAVINFKAAREPFGIFMLGLLQVTLKTIWQNWNDPWSGSAIQVHKGGRAQGKQSEENVRSVWSASYSKNCTSFSLIVYSFHRFTIHHTCLSVSWMPQYMTRSVLSKLEMDSLSLSYTKKNQQSGVSYNVTKQVRNDWVSRLQYAMLLSMIFRGPSQT